jgi:hypothetical protein
MPHRFDTDAPSLQSVFRAAGALGLREAFRQAAARSTLLAKTDAGVPYADGRNAPRRRGREAEGGGLLNRYRVSSPIEGSNPSVSAKSLY